MHLRHSRLLALSAVTGIVALFAAVPAFAAPAKAAGTTVKVTISSSNEFKFTLSTSKVKHGTVTFMVTNNGLLPHDFKVCSSNKGSVAANTCAGKGTAQITPPQSAKLTVNLSKPGKYEYLCTFPGHAQQGMKGILTVT
jgi:uncharacterized cupredoxin-like copper-binding protein